MGGGSRRDEGSLVINNTNVFAALDSLRKKKKSDKDRKSGKGSSNSKGQAQTKEPEPQVFWAPAPLNAKSWADVDDEDDDDYYATTAPANAVWGLPDQQQSSSKDEPSHVEVRYSICFFLAILLVFLYSIVIMFHWVAFKSVTRISKLTIYTLDDNYNDVNVSLPLWSVTFLQLFRFV